MKAWGFFINVDNLSTFHRNDNQVKFLIYYNKIHRQKSTFYLSEFGLGIALFLRFYNVRRFWFSSFIVKERYHVKQKGQMLPPVPSLSFIYFPPANHSFTACPAPPIRFSADFTPSVLRPRISSV